MEGSAEDLGAPESWEVADLDESMNRLSLLLSSTTTTNNNHSNPNREPADGDDHAPPPPASSQPLSSSSFSSLPCGSSSSGEKPSDDVINQVDQFLREAIQNPRERLSVLRIEQDVEKFVRDPSQKQLEFQQLPTSYLRLAAHRVAQHYSLQSMVLLDNSLADGSGSRIVVSKTSECKLPAIRLADIPVNLSPENNSVMKVAIKQRPQKRTQVHGNANSNSVKNNGSKSVEERKEEYNRARARIFSSSNNGGGAVGGKPECEPRHQENSLKGFTVVPRVEDKYASVSDVSSNATRGLVESSTNTRGMVESSTNTRGLVESSTNTRGLVESSTNTRGLVESSTNTNRARSRTEESVGRYRQSNNRVAIFRDREIDRKDPDYDRSYDRYMQRFDPGFGFSGGSYTMQPMYAPVLNYNTEFPQLGSNHAPQLSTEHQPRPLPQHIPGQWTAQSPPAGIGYGHPDTMMSPFNPSQVGAHSSSTLYLHSPQYPCQHTGMPFIHHEHVHQPFAQSHQPPPDASFGLARPR